jgi:hypothetical protein
MNITATIFEAIMLICFSISWPFAILKTIRTKNVEGVSIFFIWFVLVGYLSGILFKVSEAINDGFMNPVILLYIYNLFLVGTEMILYYRYNNIKY